MSKLKSLKESRAAIFTQIDELRTATDGREMTSEEEARWQQLLADYEKADRAVEAEERYVEIEPAKRLTMAPVCRLMNTARRSAITCNTVPRVSLPKAVRSSSSGPASPDFRPAFLSRQYLPRTSRWR